ncbi:hypothetical protein HKX48_007941 [Thoreauomyces humboldtii]|nr:hypothetical protein HKX48_007941 [Thoreauomyces humboldtii]
MQQAPAIETEADSRAALQDPSPLPLSDDFLDKLVAGTPLSADEGAAAQLFMEFMLKYRLPSEQFVKCRGQYHYCQERSNLAVSDAFVDRVLQRMRDVELTNRPLADITKAAQLVHWMGTITTEVARHFDGALRNEAEKSMRGEFSHGQVEFVWVAFQMCVVVILEMKRKGLDAENYAQLMGELEAAAFTNAMHGTTVDVILGLMANKDGWLFMNYDANTNEFAMSSTLQIDAHNSSTKLQNRVTAVCLMWSMFLQGYCNAVVAMQRRSVATVRPL